MKTPIINKIPAIMQERLDQILAPWKNEHDIKMLYDILNGGLFQNGNVTLTIKLGSSRRINYKLLDPEPEPVFYNEFKVLVRVTGSSFHFMATIFHNEGNKTEGFSYFVNLQEASELVDETWMLPEGYNGRATKFFFAEITKLLELNREIRIESTINPSESTIEKNETFNKLIAAASETEIDYLLCNELGIEEKIMILSNLDTERKQQMISNLKK